MKKFFLSFLFLILLLVSSVSAEPIDFNAVSDTTWKGIAVHFSRGPVIVAWDPVPEASFYKIRWSWVDSQGVKHDYPEVTVETTSLVVDRPRSGFFVFWARSVKVVSGVNPEDGLPWANLGEEIPSEWISSTDPDYATVDGQPMGWVVYFEVPAPSGGGID